MAAYIALIERLTMTNGMIRAAKVGAGTYDRLDDIATAFNAVPDLLDRGPHDVIVLDQPASEAAVSLKRLRTHPLYSHALIYVTHVPDKTGCALGDGQVPETREQLTRDFQTWQGRIKEIEPSLKEANLESRALSWLWTGPNRQLRAVRDPSNAELYAYPILEALSTQAVEQDFFWVLQFMSQQGWISTGQLTDRVRLCTNCNSGHLNYVDVCPDCHSLSIEREPALHCFVCGHVGPQEKFAQDRGLFCPNCLSQLRHIGSDYDRPIENYRCRDCKAFFIDADVQVRCLDCEHTHSTEQLKVREIFDYHLTDTGRMRCRLGLLGQSIDIDTHFDFQGLLKHEPFMLSIDWLLEIERRYGRPMFSIVGIRLVNFQESLQEMGERQGYALLDAVVARLVKIVRETDRCMRTSEDIIWILLPETGLEGAEIVVKRLKELAELFEQAKADIEIRSTRYSAPENVMADEDANALIGRLTSALF